MKTFAEMTKAGKTEKFAYKNHTKPIHILTATHIPGINLIQTRDMS